MTNTNSKISFKRTKDSRGWYEYHFEKGDNTCDIKMVYGIRDYWTVFINGWEKYGTEKLADARKWAKFEIMLRGWVK